MRPLITVITVCYQALKELELTVESVLNQDLSDVEYVIVDGGSTDGTCEYLTTLENNFPDGTLRWCSQKDHGVYDAMNAGVALSSGHWIIFMNAGDCFYASDTLATLKSILSAPSEADVIYGDTLMCYPWGEQIQCDDEENNHNPVMPFIHQSVFVKRELLVNYPFDLQYHIIADFDFFHKLRKKNIIFSHHSVIVSKYNASEGLSATSPLKIALERAKILGEDQRPFWFLKKIYILIRSGCVQPLKKTLPTPVVKAIMRSRRKYLKSTK